MIVRLDDEDERTRMRVTCTDYLLSIKSDG